MRALPGREAAASRLRTGDQGEPCLQPAASARGDLGRRAAGVYRPRARSRQGKLPGVAGKERVGGVMAMANPPRNGEGDRAQRGGGGVPQMRRPEVSAARKLRREPIGRASSRGRVCQYVSTRVAAVEINKKKPK